MEKLYLFVEHYEQHFKYTMSNVDLNMFMASKLVKNINHIGTVKMSMKTFYICMEKHLLILRDI